MNPIKEKESSKQPMIISLILELPPDKCHKIARPITISFTCQSKERPLKTLALQQMTSLFLFWEEYQSCMLFHYITNFYSLHNQVLCHSNPPTVQKKTFIFPL